MVVNEVFLSCAEALGQTPDEQASMIETAPPVPTSVSVAAVALLLTKTESERTRDPACKFKAPPRSVATLPVKLLLAIVTFVGRDTPLPT